MRALMCVVLVAWSGAVMAQDIVQANAAFAAKDYPKAMSLYSALAASNNAEAQLRLGEVYGYGEGAPLDGSEGDALFAEAALASNQEAAAGVRRTAQRAYESAASACWTTDDHSEELTEGNCACTLLT